MKAFPHFSKLVSVLNIPLQQGSLIHFSMRSSIHSLKKQLVNVNDVPGTMTGYEKTNMIETWPLTGRSSQSGEEGVYA